MKDNPPFRAEHIGSLLRPRALIDSFKARREDDITQGELDEVLDGSVAEAIRLQEEAGMHAITDGEFRRGSWFLGFVDAVEGLTTAPSLFQFSGDHAAWQCPYAESKIVRTKGIATEEFAFVRDHTARTPKVTLPSPTAMVFWRGKQAADSAAYPDIEAYFADLAGIYRAELQALADAGCTYVQLDEVPIAMLCDPNVQETIRQAGDDPDETLRRFVELVNEALRDRPAELTVGMHLCRGNYKGQWMAEGGYEPVADLLFNGIAVDAFFLEFDSARAGGFEPLRFLPDEKIAVLGLLTTKVPESPSADALGARVDEAAKIVPLERLAISPQCGFASSVGGNPVTIDDEKRKLALVAEVATTVWG